MKSVSFRIGDAFPAEDPVARFVTVVAMMSNDWLRLMAITEAAEADSADVSGVHLLSFRQQAALYHEAAKFLAESRARFPEVDAFILSLDATAQDAYERVVGGRDPKSPHFLGKWLVDQRNVTFHYPRMRREAAAHGDEELTDALTRVADLNGRIIEGKTLADLRFLFADEVVVQWTPTGGDEAAFEALARSVMALGQFGWAAMVAYLRPRGESGVIRPG